MEIISHRGYWKQPSEKNCREAFERSFLLGFGTETDLRDAGGEVVISHDIPKGSEISFTELLNIYVTSQCNGTLALNIKADGLQEIVLKELNKFGVKNYFLFDMSVPDCLVSLRHSLTCFARHSEYEPPSLLWSYCQGVWYDNFNGASLNKDILVDVINSGKKVCIVSSELHGRDHVSLWKEISEIDSKIYSSDRLILCTDIPEAARSYFNE